MNQLTRRRVVPWKNRKEFECVYNEVFGNDPKLQAHAVGRIDVWRSRALHKIPVAIDSTAAIVHAKLHHQEAVQSTQDRQQDNEIRSAYSLALIRFVNHITEKGQSGGYAQPVHVLASKFGVPVWIVDLRHDATHRQLPPLPMLMTACDWALSWLKTEFWKEQLNSMAQKIDLKTSQVAQTLDVREIVEKYQQQKFQEISGKKNKDKSGKILQDLERVHFENGEELVTCLVDDGFIIPTQEQLLALRIDSSNLDMADCALPQTISLFWKPVLQFLHQYELTNSLLIKLASKITTKSCLQNHIMCGWIHHIISSNEHANSRNSYRSPTRQYKWSEPLTFRPALESLVHIPCDHTTPLIKRLLDLGEKNGEYTKTQASMINGVMTRLQPSLPIGQAAPNRLGETVPIGQGEMNRTEDQDKNIYNVKDVKSRKRKLETLEDDFPVKVMWQICEDDVDWSQVPIGILPGQTLDYLTLDLSTNIEKIEMNIVDKMEESCCDFEYSTCEEDIDDGMIWFKETCHQDEGIVPTSTWSLQQMVEIKQGVRLL
ncbi:ribosomal biogenesis protein LAS1L-like [Mizuhopecten yessoensis]|uniref:Ribosomal biogenesis protein LAS1L n=1 Tax=Mizuhopecten yessoensis TaxID=6573 RepID=A0A210PM52_MIZYE|nr:ribosomal biogenesis protein LAS1L-like [Mizuhopecten yessoensis]OWF37544.1 Ribosomal biogenesis protein LAS1L [Mizuhopecten yessoensis]